MTTYTCPMHPEIEQDHPGKCPKCGGMDLVPKESLSQKSDGESWVQKYKPLLIIAGLIALASLVTAYDGNTLSLMDFLIHFMAGFFLVFSGFKLMDLKGFAEGYATYDLLAKRVHAYGFVYPFLELALGLAYLTRYNLVMTNKLTLVLMTFSGIGVLIAVLKKQKFQCACLGTFIKVPLTTVTIIEDFGMAIMAGGMLFTLYSS